MQQTTSQLAQNYDTHERDVAMLVNIVVKAVATLIWLARVYSRVLLKVWYLEDTLLALAAVSTDVPSFVATIAKNKAE
jgi:hypothetical protein